MKKRITEKEQYEKLTAACEPFKRAKAETIHTIAGIGRRHRLLRYPIMAALVVFIFIYNVILYGCIQLKVREKLARGIALVMTITLVFTSVDITVFATTGQTGGEAQDKGEITAFHGLDESVAAQSLPVGAEESEIFFPDTLTVTLETESEEEPKESIETEKDAVPEENAALEEGATQEEDTALKKGAEPEEGDAPEKSTAPAEETTLEENAAPTLEDGTEPTESTEPEEVIEPKEVTEPKETSIPVENAVSEANKEPTSAESTPEIKSEDTSGGQSDDGLEDTDTVAAVIDFLLPEPMLVYAAEPDGTEVSVERMEGSAVQMTGISVDVTEVSIDVTWNIDAAASTSAVFDSSKAGNSYVYVPVIPEEYVVAKGVSLPEIIVTVRDDRENETATAAEKLLEEILRNYFDGLEDDEIYDAILGMDEETRLLLTADYEELLAALTQEDDGNERLRELMEEIFCGITDAAENMPIKMPVLYQMNALTAAETSDSIALKRLDGSGNAFVYHSFVETKTFVPGVTYAFLNGVYEYDDAVSSLGAGAILKATDTENKSSKYIKGKYGESAQVKVYVDVVTKGRDFDHCVIGGLYEVPDSGTPTEYRYFCGAGGAQNCGPYYAYDYVKESLGFDDVSASLKTIEKQGSEDPEDYIVIVTYNDGQSKTLDTGSYTVQVPDKASDKVTFVISDSEGNSITANFQCPLVICYDGNAENVTNVPSIQPMWKGKKSTISSQKPTRDGYEFINWKDDDTGTTYTAGQSFTPAKSLHLLAQWKDVKAPEVGYTPTQVMTGTSDADVKKAVEAALTITDNEPVSECTVEVTLSSSNFTSTVGNKNVTVKVTDKAGNSTTKTCTVNVASYVDISMPVFTADTKNLTATLNNPGTDTITESGFVWGIMNAPSITVNNGKAKTTTVASKVNDKISVTANNLQKGVIYYARAYIIAGGITYYSEEIEIGIDLPAYGTFTIKNNGDNTFTVTRSGGSEGEQTVYYRTVNGSAVGGTHFTHQAKTLTFAAGETSPKAITITVPEQTANTAYSSAEAATAYTNADRTYSVEIYRIKGGGSLGSATSAVRTMSMNSDYKINRSLYTSTGQNAKNTATWDCRGSSEYVVIDGGKGETNGSNNGINLYNGRTNLSGYDHDPYYLPRYHQKISLSTYEKAYFTGGSAADSGDGWGYRYVMRTQVIEGFWGHIWVGNAAAPGGKDQKSKITSGSSNGSGALDTDNQKWAGCFDSDVSGFSNGTKDLIMPGTTGDGLQSVKEKCTFRTVDGRRYVLFGIDETAYMHFAACGGDKDAYKINSITEYLCLIDTKEPELVAVAPMAGGLYKAGDSFTVSLIFDEIVDSKNSSLSSVKVKTTWGEATYAGGADTNVLYFKGTVAANATSPLEVNEIVNPGNIKDMCNCETSTATTSKTGNTTATVDVSTPDFTVTEKGIANGTGTAAIIVNSDKAKTTGMRYAWSDSATAPTSGWVELSSAELTTAKASGGLSLSIRKEPGSGSSNGKWYLHAIGSYDTTGATTYKYACVDFGTKNSPASGSTQPSLAVTVNNTNWATSRTITISAVGAEALKYRKSGSTAWTELSKNATSVTVTENGYYTFLLTAGDITVTKTVQVEKIDTDNPTASVGEPTSDSVKSPTAGVYTKLILPISYADAQSGVKSVQYAWTNSQTTPSSWESLSSGAASVTYTIAESTPTKKYLYLIVTDKVGHTYTTCSAAYTVISQSAVNAHTPTITITGAPASWTNDMVTLTWKLENDSGKNYEVILPNGTKAKVGAVNGEVWAMQNGTYTVKVRDLDYGGENTASVTVNKLDFTAPSVTVSGASESWENNAQTLTLTALDTGSGVGDIWYKIVSKDEYEKITEKTTAEMPADGLTNLAATNRTITISEDGEWYLYYKVYDKTGDTEAGREANKTEGFTELIQIDKTAPVIGVLQYSYEPENLWDWLIGKESLMITVPVTEEGSGADEIAYTVKSEDGQTESKTAKITNGVAKITLSPDFKGAVSITCTDKAGNTSSSVTVGESGKGIILEDNAPEITFGSYTAASGMTITVKDDKDGAVSTGLSSVTYQIGDSEEVSVPGNFADSLKTSVSFEIKPEQIPLGGTEIIVQAEDNAGNQAKQKVTIEKHTVTYDYGTNGGTSATKISDVILADEEIDLMPTATKEDWEFVGWNTDKDAKTGLTSLAMGNGDVTLYAVYSKTLMLTCYSGSAGDKQTKTVTIYNNAAEGSLTVPDAKKWKESDESYQFYAYAVNPDEFDGIQYSTGSTIFISKDTSLYALYKKEIQISYDANGGGGSVEGQTVYQYANMADTVTYQTDSFILREGTGFSRTGYNFIGWIVGSRTGNVIAAGTSITPTGNTTYYAGWKEADYTITLHPDGGNGGKELTSYTYGTGAVLPADWTKTGYTFGGWYDNEKCTGTAVAEISATTTGDKEYWAKWIDNIAPVIGTLTSSYEPKNLWQWLIGKESLMITVPVTEEGSGADKITYTVTPEGGLAEEKTAGIENGSAEIAVSPDFKGTIAITCTDKAGNTSSSVTAGAGMGAAGIIIEDNAPEIIFLTGGSMPSREYPAAPEITVTVTDDKENAISAGLASVTCQIGDDVENALQEDFAASMKNEVSFTIAEDQIPSGNVEIIVKATDNAGNRTEQKLTIHVHSGIFVEAKAATCTVNGYSAYYVCSCGKRFSDSACTIEVTVQDVTIPAKGHTAVTDPVKAATCTETGLTEGSHCSVCGHVIKAQTVTAALGHDYGGDYHYDAGGHWKVCRRCGEEDTKHSHVYDNDSDAVCNDCDYERAVKNPDTEESGSETPKPAEPPAPSGKADLPEQPVEPSEDKPETTPDTQDDRQPKDDKVPEDTKTLGQTAKEPFGTQKEQQPEKEGVQTIPAVADNGRMTISGEPVATGNVEGMTDTSTALNLGGGAVIVTVVCEEQEYTAGVADTAAVANAVLTPEQIQLVADGETIEIRIDVTDISGKVPSQDEEVIEDGIKAYQNELPGLTLGMYVDISMFIKIGAGDWNAVTATKEPIEVVIGIPQKLQSDDREFYIIRSHEGEYTLLTDMDEEPDTITIRTDMFSAYAIAYEQADKQETDTENHKCGLCHICPTFLGICYFVWLAIIIAVFLIIWIVIRRNRKEKEEQEE